MTRNIRLIYLHNFLTNFQPQWPFLAIYCAQITGSYTMGMAVLATERLVNAVADIPTGILSDKIGRKYTIVIGSVALALRIVCYAFAHSSPVLFIGAILYGLGSSLFSGNNDALMYESLKSKNKEDQFHHYQGQAGSMFQLGLGLSALVATCLVSQGLRLVFIVGIIPQVLSVIVSLFFEEPKVHVPSKHKSWAHLRHSALYIFSNKRLLLLTAGNSISNGVGEAHFQFITVFIQTLWPTWALGLYRAINHALGFISFWIAGRILDRIRAAYVLIVTEGSFFITNSLALAMANVFSPIIYILGTLAYGPFEVARDQILQKEFSDEQRATMGSIVSFSWRMVYGLSLLALGSIADHWGVRVAAAFAVGTGVLALPMYIKLFRIEDSKFPSAKILTAKD